MTHVEFEYHFAKEAERFGISKLIRENNKDCDFQSFMLSLSGIVARNEPIDEEELDEISIQEAIKHKDDGVNVYGHLNCDDQSFMEGYSLGYIRGYKTAKQE